MKKLRIQGGNQLRGTIRISGAKNSSVALIPASILADDIVTICNIPDITDTDALSDILEYLGADVKRASESIVINPKLVVNRPIPEVLAKRLRASYYFMGALLGKYKYVEMSFPGGCLIGARPINLHLKGFEALGAKVTQEKDIYRVEADKLVGANIYLDIASVGATINIMLAAVRAEGTTVIDNAAKEPEVVNIATFLNNMGARISGAGTSEIRITGVSKLNGCFHEVIPDRIEAGTYTIIGALVGEQLKIDNIIPEHIEALISKLKEIGVDIKVGTDYLIVSRGEKYKSVNVKTLVFPGFPTDLQQPFSILLTQCNGKSIVEETIYENRFMHINELKRMGADAMVEGMKAIISGPSNLKGEEVTATDLRAGASLICAALVANGETVINQAEHILRGYENIVEKLSDIGAEIQIEEI